MARHAAFLKGMNLGRRRISNAELAEAFRRLGFAEVATFRASGNVAFEVPRTPAATLLARIEEGLQTELGYPVPTLLRNAARMASIAAHEPFATREAEDYAGKLQVGLLAREPSSESARAALALAGAEDLLALDGAELYWLPRGGTIDSPLDLKALEGLLGAMTFRTKGTVELMAAKLF